MGAISPTLAKRTELGGDYKLFTFTATVSSADDAFTLTQADHGISEIAGIVGAVITGGLDAAFSAIQVSFSTLTVTIASFDEAGSVATDFTDTTVSITLLGKSE
jgi:hypothetical protein